MSSSVAITYTNNSGPSIESQKGITFTFKGNKSNIPANIGGLSTGNLPNYSSSSSNSKNLKADLKIVKTTKSGNTHKVYIKNIGKKAAGKSVLGVFDGKKLIKKVSVKAIAKGKTVQVKVTLPGKYKNKIKSFKTDAGNLIKESNEKNNVLKTK